MGGCEKMYQYYGTLLRILASMGVWESPPEGARGCILRSAILYNLAYIYWKQWERERSKQY